MKPVGVFTIIIGAVMAFGGALYGIAAMGEFARYSDLQRSGNPFAGTASNSGVYLFGIAAVAVLGGVVAILAGSQMRRTPQERYVVGQAGNGVVWDGTRWVTNVEWNARGAQGMAGNVPS